ncbi:MAG TPA: hypothetical protein VI461_09850, partial [Chitinophagaceae bacterium]|nr:hypothetical protein [Chitinophagaceae bacterium]
MSTRKKNFSPILFISISLLIVGCTSPGKQEKFRDLNKNDKMDVYEDIAQPIEKRIDDLLQQMTLAEKAGLM